MTIDEIKKVFNPEFVLNGEYFKNINHKMHILKNDQWVEYNFIFTHDDMIRMQYIE